MNITSTCGNICIIMFYLFVVYLMVDVGNLEYIGLYDWRSNELEMMWNEADVA